MFHKKLLLILLVLTSIGSAGFAQDTLPENKIWQLSGLVINRTTMDPVPFATVRIFHSRRAISCNAEGYYSIPVVLDDTVIFSGLGYEPSSLVMRTYLENYQGNKESDYLYAINYLEEDSIILQTVILYPWNTPEALRTAMIEANTLMPLDEQYARNNMNPELLAELMKNVSVSEDERLSVASQIYATQYVQKNVVQTANIFNPVAVYQLLKYIADKAKDKRDKDLNYWEE